MGGERQGIWGHAKSTSQSCIYLFCSFRVHSNHSCPSLHSPQFSPTTSLFLQIHPTHLPSEKKRPPKDQPNMAQQATVRPRRILSFQGWTRQPSRRIKVPWVGKRVRDNPYSHCQEPHKNTKIRSHNIYAKEVGQTPTGSLISVSPHESRSDDSMGYVSRLLWFLQSFLPLLSRTPPTLPNPNQNSKGETEEAQGSKV